MALLTSLLEACMFVVQIRLSKASDSEKIHDEVPSILSCPSNPVTGIFCSACHSTADVFSSIDNAFACICRPIPQVSHGCIPSFFSNVFTKDCSCHGHSSRDLSASAPAPLCLFLFL